ncbi:MAG: hypothetical protein J6N15_01425 [Ruminiclostridium sp.]|nr:hypothetical protein [Ruminiclostridium sp.]
MLDKNDLQAIGELIHAEVAASEERMISAMDSKIAASEERMTGKIEAAARQAVKDAVSQAVAYSENTIETKLDAIKEGLDLALETRIPAERIERIEEDIIALKSVVRKHSEEIDRLKKAQ